MIVQKFAEVINESKGDTTLFRLVSVPHGSPLVVDTKNPGRYYFTTQKSIDPSILKNKSGDLHLLKVTTPSSNIDNQASSEESKVHGKNSVVVIEDPSKAQIISIEPYKKAA